MRQISTSLDADQKLKLAELYLAVDQDRELPLLKGAPDSNLPSNMHVLVPKERYVDKQPLDLPTTTLVNRESLFSFERRGSAVNRLAQEVLQSSEKGRSAN